LCEPHLICLLTSIISIANLAHIWWITAELAKGPSFQDVGKFSRFLTPTPLRRQLFTTIFVSKFLTPPSLKSADVLNGWSLSVLNSSSHYFDFLNFQIYERHYDCSIEFKIVETRASAFMSLIFLPAVGVLCLKCQI
jgi:hypothetical protein